MEKTYEIEKRTPSGNWQTVHTGVTNPAGLMAEIARNYDSDRETPFNMEVDIQDQIDDPSREYARMVVFDMTEDRSPGDMIEYRVKEEQGGLK